MELLATWQKSYGLRYCPITLIQIGFSAGTVHLLIAIQACSGVRIAQKELRYALDQQKVLLQHLTEIGHSWLGAIKIAGILTRLMQDRLMPILEQRKIYVCNGEIYQRLQLGDEPTFSPPPASRYFQDSDQVCDLTLKNGENPLTVLTPMNLGSSIGTGDFPSLISTRLSRQEQPALPIAVSQESTSLESSSPSSFVYIREASTDTIGSPSSQKTSPGTPLKLHSANPFDWLNWQSSPPKDYSDVPGLHMDFQPDGSSKSFGYGQNFQITPSLPGSSYPSGSALRGFAGVPGEETKTVAPFWKFGMGDESFMDDTVYDATPSSSSLPLLKQTTNLETDHNSMHLTPSEAANVGMDTAACMDELAEWVSLVSQKIS